MKHLLLIAAALLVAAPTGRARPVHFDVIDNYGRIESRSYFLRTEPGRIVVFRSGLPDRDGQPAIFFVRKADCGDKHWLVHKRYVNGALDWTQSDNVMDGNWQPVPLYRAEHFKWLCSWGDGK